MRCGVPMRLKVPLIKLFQHTHPPFKFVMQPREQGKRKEKDILQAEVLKRGWRRCWANHRHFNAACAIFAPGFHHGPNDTDLCGPQAPEALLGTDKLEEMS
jgi:hypothetical protein